MGLKYMGKQISPLRREMYVRVQSGYTFSLNENNEKWIISVTGQCGKQTISYAAGTPV